MELARTLLSHADVYVNTVLTLLDGSKVSPLALALVAVGQGEEGEVELVRMLLSHANIDVNAMSTLLDGSKVSPLALALVAVG